MKIGLFASPMTVRPTVVEATLMFCIKEHGIATWLRSAETQSTGEGEVDEEETGNICYIYGEITQTFTDQYSSQVCRWILLKEKTHSCQDISEHLTSANTDLIGTQHLTLYNPTINQSGIFSDHNVLFQKHWLHTQTN